MQRCAAVDLPACDRERVVTPTPENIPDTLVNSLGTSSVSVMLDRRRDRRYLLYPSRCVAVESFEGSEVRVSVLSGMKERERRQKDNDIHLT